MQVAVVFFLIFMGTSCGMSLMDILNKKGPRPNVTTDKKFTPFIERFNSYAAKHRGPSWTAKHRRPYWTTKYRRLTKMNIPIIFGSPDNSDFVGVCEIYEDGLKIIRIRRTYWDSKDEDTKESLILHEIGHCFLNRNSHVRDTTKKGDKKSLMHEEVVNGQDYKKFQDYYLQELLLPETQPVFPQI